MREYTGMYIIHPEHTEEEFKAIVSEIAKIFEEHGSRVLEIDEWGMKDLAYEINDLKKGYYVKFRVEATPEAVSEYNRICNIREDIIRHILEGD
ncbi:MAG: 30S ribosomal protein S6 [Bacilli bacterium]